MKNVKFCVYSKCIVFLFLTPPLLSLPLLLISPQVSQHPNSQRLRQLQPEHGVLRALDHPVPALHHLPLQEEAKEPPRRPQPPGGQLAPLPRSTVDQTLPPPTAILYTGHQTPGPQTMRLYEALR